MLSVFYPFTFYSFFVCATCWFRYVHRAGKKDWTQLKLKANILKKQARGKSENRKWEK